MEALTESIKTFALIIKSFDSFRVHVLTKLQKDVEFEVPDLALDEMGTLGNFDRQEKEQNV